MARIREHDCLATVRSMTTPGASSGEVTSETLPQLRYVCLLGTPPAGLPQQDGWRPALFSEMVAGGAQVSAGALRERQASVKPTDPAQSLYTSGTTRRPNGPVQSQRAILNNGAIFARCWAITWQNHLCTSM